MPTVSLPGGRTTCRGFRDATYGASERFSVAPGPRERGLLSHAGRTERQPAVALLSAGFADWVAAKPLVLPGPRRTRTLRLRIDLQSRRRIRLRRSRPTQGSGDRSLAVRQPGRSRLRSPRTRPSAQIWFTGHTIGLPLTQPRASAPGVRGAQRSTPLHAF